MAINAKTTGEPTAADNPVKVRFARVNSNSASLGGVVHLDADDFARFEECMNQPKGPTEALLRAARLHQEMASHR
jgi:hypothetical protein